MFRFDSSRRGDVRRIGDVPTAGVNFVVLSTGVCLHLTDDGVLEVFSNRPHADAIRTFADPRLSADCRLPANGAQALFARGRTLCRLRLPRSPSVL